MATTAPLYSPPGQSEDSSAPGCPSLGRGQPGWRRRGQRRSHTAVPEICQKRRYTKPHAAPRPDPRQRLSPARLCGHV